MLFSLPHHPEPHMRARPLAAPRLPWGHALYMEPGSLAVVDRRSAIHPYFKHGSSWRDYPHPAWCRCDDCRKRADKSAPRASRESEADLQRNAERLILERRQRLTP